MDESNEKNSSSVSKAKSYVEIAEFWDNHSLDDHMDGSYEVEFDVLAPNPRQVMLDPDVYAGLETQARIRGLKPETLVNLWLYEKLHQAN